MTRGMMAVTARAAVTAFFFCDGGASRTRVSDSLAGTWLL